VIEDLKRRARERIEAGRDDLIALSHRIHAEPEILFEEERSSAWTAEALEAAGFEVERGAAGLPTAFVARSASGPLHVGVCAEYDALPAIGHACGHNVIAAAAVGAGLGLIEVADDAGLTISVLGTPAEEGGGGKVLMMDAGVFEGIHAAMMVHPAPVDLLRPNVLALWRFEARYTGKEAHASAAPDEGVNAGDALTVAQVAVGLLRQQLRQTDRVHGIVTKGGDAPNVIPADARASYIVRAATVQELGGIKERALACFEAGALATGATLAVRPLGPEYAEMRHDDAIVEVYRRNAEAVGRTFPDLGPLAQRFAFSTDMGNVSLAIPSIHPLIGIDSLPAVNHQPEFAAACAGESADRAVIDGAVAMAWTAIDLAADSALRDRLIANPPNGDGNLRRQTS
jgi:amidohydrolase